MTDEVRRYFKARRIDDNSMTLAIPATSTPGECVFSLVGLTTTEQRSSLTGSLDEALVFMKYDGACLRSMANGSSSTEGLIF